MGLNFAGSEVYWVAENGVLPTNVSRVDVGSYVAARVTVGNDLLCGKLKDPDEVYTVFDGTGTKTIGGYQVMA